VAYVIEATAACEPASRRFHEHSFARAAGEKALVHFGLPAFTAMVRLATEDDIGADTFRPDVHDLGWLIRDLRDHEKKVPTFFRAQLVNGCMKVSGPQLTAS